MKSPWRGAGGEASVKHPSDVHSPRKVSFLKMFSSTYVNRGDPAPSLLSSLATAALSALPCGGERHQWNLRVSTVSFGCVAHLQRDPVVFSRHESVDVVVPELLHHGRQLSVTLDHDVAAAAALLVLQWWAVAGWVSEGASNRRKCTFTLLVYHMRGISLEVALYQHKTWKGNQCRRRQ